MGNVEPVVAAEGEEEVVAGDSRDLLRLEAEQLSDAVVLVDDVVARAEVGERLQRAAEAGVGPAAAACGRPGCRAAARARARARRSRGAPARPRRAAAASDGSSSPGSSSAASTLRSRFCVRSASPRWGNATTTRWPGADERRQLVLGLREPAGGERGPLRLEGERLAPRERVELRRAVEQLDRLEALLLPDLAHLVRLPDEVGRPGSGGTRSSRDRRPGRSSSERRLDEVEAPLGRRVDDRLRRPGAGSRCVNGENARTASISSPKSSMRSGSRPVAREDVDEAAAHGELPALVGPLDPLVAGERQASRPASRCQARRRREPGRAGGRAPAGGMPSATAAAEAQTRPPAAEHVERPGALADEVRRRLEPGAPAHAAARAAARRRSGPRSQPAASARSRASASSGSEHDERAVEVLVQCGDDERQRRLGHARTGRQRVREAPAGARSRRARARADGARDGP